MHLPNEDVAKKTRHLLENGVSIASVYEYFGEGEIPQRDISWFDREQEEIHQALFTNDQKKAIDEISVDLSSTNKMLRLLQGDVGSGKTIVALFSILQSIENQKRSILMAPTELLAEQHYNTINEYITIDEYYFFKYFSEIK